MKRHDEENLLARQPPEPRTQRLGAGKNFLCLLAGVAGTTCVAVAWFSYSKQPPQVVIAEAKPLTRADTMPSNATGDGVLPFQQGYLGHSRDIVQEPPKQRPEPPTPEPMQKPMVSKLPDSIVIAAVTASPFQEQPVKKESTPEPKSTQASTPPQRGEKREVAVKEKRLWMYAKLEANPLEQKITDKVGKAIGADPKKQETSDLIKPANWARAADPVHVLYNVQTIEASVRQEINSDIPGDAVFLVTRNVYDALGQEEILIPQFSLMKGGYTSSTQYGQTRLDIGIREIQFPDKTILALDKAKLTDKSGAVGGAGEVDNHYFKLGMAVVLSTVLNIGAQSVAGNTSGYYPTVEQKAAEQLGQGVNQAGQQIVKKQLEVGPTITIKAGEHVGVQFHDNLSLSKAPLIIK